MADLTSQNIPGASAYHMKWQDAALEYFWCLCIPHDCNIFVGRQQAEAILRGVGLHAEGQESRMADLESQDTTLDHSWCPCKSHEHGHCCWQATSRGHTEGREAAHGLAGVPHDRPGEPGHCSDSPPL